MQKDIFETFTQEKLTEGIRQNDERIIKWIYQKNFLKVQQMVLANSGTMEQAKDLYQEAFLSFWTGIKTGKFHPENNSALGGYLYQIAKNKWLDVVRSSGFKMTVFPEVMPEKVQEEQEDKEGYYLQIEGAFAKLGETCKELLTRFYYQKESLSALSTHFGWTEASTKNNKYRCMEKLRSSLKSES
ncbi:RNA polymerase sigma factor [Algoriphagus litoralis]|uniref:RNA polymerase sigma factor n=1 Tax=Algoriphagus litoralis TaxID=2202829 RepID=UPI000DB95460|nr:sigma-70 family RNA polymerase sigma factor [Algoriphagus litoralis]